MERVADMTKPQTAAGELACPEVIAALRALRRDVAAIRAGAEADRRRKDAERAAAQAWAAEQREALHRLAGR